MANGRKTGGKDFPKGKSPNPDGRPPLPDALKKIRTNSRAIILQGMCDIIMMPVKDIDRLAENAEASSMTALLASVMSKGIALGCQTRAQFFMSYMVGKPLDFDPADLQNEDEIVQGAINQMPSSVLTNALKEYKNALQKQPAG